MGMEDWAWDKVEPYFKRLENVTWETQSKVRGHGGPIDLSKPLIPFKWPK
jgi:choline dehydrogenase-like flavoprotein